jgi:hypothetical protein
MILFCSHPEDGGIKLLSNVINTYNLLGFISQKNLVFFHAAVGAANEAHIEEVGANVTCVNVKYTVM